MKRQITSRDTVGGVSVVSRDPERVSGTLAHAQRAAGVDNETRHSQARGESVLKCFHISDFLKLRTRYGRRCNKD